MDLFSEFLPSSRFAARVSCQTHPLLTAPSSTCSIDFDMQCRSPLYPVGATNRVPDTRDHAACARFRLRKKEDISRNTKQGFRTAESSMVTSSTHYALQGLQRELEELQRDAWGMGSHQEAQVQYLVACQGKQHQQVLGALHSFLGHITALVSPPHPAHSPSNPPPILSQRPPTWLAPSPVLTSYDRAHIDQPVSQHCYAIDAGYGVPAPISTSLSWLGVAITEEWKCRVCAGDRTNQKRCIFLLYTGGLKT